MVIAHVLSSFDLGGQERIALDLARQQVAAGERVVAISLATGPAGVLAGAFHQAGARVHRVPKGEGVDVSLVLRLAACLRREGADIVHTHNPHALVYGAPAGKLARALVVHSKHGVNPDSTRRRLIRRGAAALVDCFVAVTPALAEVARQRHECAHDRLRVVPNGIDVSRFAHSARARREVRAELAIAPDAWVVGTVGRLAPEKNQRLLLDALALLPAPPAHAVIVGDGPERPALVARIAAQGLGSRVHLAGARDDVPRVLSAFDVFALTSRSEGLPLVVLEAMASALPVVATSVGGMADLVQHADTGLLVADDDAPAFAESLDQLRADRALADRLSTAGHERVVALHSIEETARRYQVIYSELLVRRRLERARALAGAWTP